MLERIDYPRPWALLWTADALAVAYVVLVLALRWRGWARGAPLLAPPVVDRGRAARIWLVEVLAQRQILQLSMLRWCAHLCVFWGFIALGLLSLFLAALRWAAGRGLDGGVAEWALRGEGQALVKAWGNGFGLLLLAGLLLALAGRLLRPPGAAGASRESDTPLVLFLLWLTLSGFLLEGLRAGAAGAAPHAVALRRWLTALWTLHGLSGVALIAWLPRSSLIHGLTAPLVIALNARNEHARRDLYWPTAGKRRATGSPGP